MRKEVLNVSVFKIVFTYTQLFLYSLDVDALVLVLVLDWIFVSFVLLFLFFGRKRKNSNFDASYILNQLIMLEIMSSQNDFKKDSTFVKILKSIP